MKKILFITTMAGHAWGGSEELWVKMAKDHLSAGAQVYCSFFRWRDIPKKIQDLAAGGACLLPRSRFQFTELWKKPWGKVVEHLLAYRQLTSIIRKSQPDKIIISMGGFCDLEVDVYRKFLLNLEATPFEIIIHANPENYYLNGSKIKGVVQVCKKASKVWFVSNRLKEIAIRQTGYSFPNSGIIINPVNMEETGILPWPKNEALQIAIVGRLEASVKGHPLLFQALSQAQWKDRQWHLNIFGSGPDEAYYKHLVSSFGLTEKVTFKGFTNDIRQDIWAQNHLLVMPSYYEGMPIALVEAMLCGRTAVVTNVGGNAEIIIDNENGFIADGVHLASFSNALERAWARKNQLEAMGRKAFGCTNKFHQLGK